MATTLKKIETIFTVGYKQMIKYYNISSSEGGCSECGFALVHKKDISGGVGTV